MTQNSYSKMEQSGHHKKWSNKKQTQNLSGKTLSPTAPCLASGLWDTVIWTPESRQTCLYPAAQHIQPCTSCLQFSPADIL